MIAAASVMAAAATAVDRAVARLQAVRLALVAAAVFAALTLTGPATAPAFQRLVAEGAGFVTAMGLEAAAVLKAELAEAFRMLFVSGAVLMAGGALFAWRVPLRRV